MADQPEQQPSEVQPSPNPVGAEAPVPADGTEASAGATDAADTPYRNLWVPLVVIPAVVIGVLVLVFALFGQVTGKEAGLEQNLQRVLGGGKNEREQATFNLVRHILANRKAVTEGREPQWDAPENFPQQLEEAWESLQDEENPNLPLVVATLMVEFELPDALEKVSTFLDLDAERDPDAMARLMAIQTLAERGGVEWAPKVITILNNPEDRLLQVAAAAALQRLPGEASVTALRDALKAEGLDLRATAALSLSHLGDASGEALLGDLTRTELYEAEHAADPAKFGSGETVRLARVAAVQALARLKVRKEAVQALLDDTSTDPVVREAAMLALEQY